MALIESFTAKAITTGVLGVGAIGGAAAVINQAGEGISGSDCTTMDARAAGETIENAYSDRSVAELQQALIESGVIDSILGGADGDFGAISCTALDVFQEQNNLVNDLKLGPQTAGALGVDIGDLELKSVNKTNDLSIPSENDVVIDCYISSDVLFAIGDRDGFEDYEDVQYIQRALNNAGYAMPVDGDFGPVTKDAVLKFQDEYQLGTDCVVGKVTHGAMKEFADPLDTPTVTVASTDTDAPVSGVRAGCEPYHASTQIVLCGSAGQGDEPVELYIRGADGSMYLQSSAMGRSSRYDTDGSGKEDCITPRNHVKLDKNSMQEESSKGLKYFIPFGNCGGGGGTAFHYYPYLAPDDDSHGCFRTPHDFIKNAFITIKNGGQTEVIVRDK